MPFSIGWVGLSASIDVAAVAVLIAVFAGVLDADVLDALEVAGDVLDLPA